MKKTICTLVLIFALGADAKSGFETWHNSDKWDVAGEAMLNQDDNRRLAGKPGTGILINGKEGKCPSLVTKRRDYRDVEVHVEVPYACGTNLDHKQYPQGPIIIQGDYGSIAVRKLIPEIPGFGNMEQFNLRSKGGMGHLESYYFLPKETAKKMGLKDQEKPHIWYIDPEVGVWHTVKLTMQGRTCCR